MVGQDVLGRLLDEDPEGLSLPAGEAPEAAASDEIEEGVEVDELLVAVDDVVGDDRLDVQRYRVPQRVVFQHLLESTCRDFAVRFAVRFLRKRKR